MRLEAFLAISGIIRRELVFGGADLDRNKYSAIAHRHHTFYNPMNPDKINTVIDLLSLTSEGNVLDIGSGKGEILLRIIEKYGCHEIGRAHV